MATKEYEYLFKLLMIGDSGVGKSCIIFRFAENNFLQSFIATIGIDFKIRTIVVDGKRVKLQVWDTAGQERFRTITTSYYRGAMGVFLVYDVTFAESYDNIRNWIGNVAQHANVDVEKMLLANKSDLASERVISREQGEKLASEHRMHFAECSAKTGSGIEEAFTLMAREIKAKLERRSEAAAAAAGGVGAASRNGSAGRSFFGRLRKREAASGASGRSSGRKSKCSLL